LDPTVEVLQQLSNLYSFSANPTKQTQILEEMLKRYPEQVGGYRDLARLLMSGGQYARTVDVLLALKSRIPKGLDPENMQMLVYALLNLGRKDDALFEARDWLSRQRGSRSSAMVTELLQQGGSPELAWLWVEDLRGLMPHSMEVLLQWGQVALATGRGEVVFPILETALRRGELPQAGVALFSEVAVSLRQFGKAIKVMATLPEGERPQWLQQSLAEGIVANGGGFVARAALPLLENRFLESYPVLAAELHLRAGSSLEEFQRWLQRGRVATLEPEWRLRLASLLMRIGRLEEGGERLMAMAQDPKIPDAVFRELAEYFIQAKNVNGGLEFFEKIKKIRAGDRIEEARAILLVSHGGREDECMAWLAQRPTLANGFLTDAASRALDTRQLRLAQLALDRLMVQPMDDSLNMLGREGRGRVLLLARLDLADHQAMAALQKLKPIQYLLDESENRFYEEVVIASWRARQPVRTEVMNILQSRLNAPWQVVNAESRRQYGMLAIEAGEKGMGIKAFLDAAAEAPPDSQEVAQLMYILGPRPEKTALDWLEGRANKANERDLAGWVEILVSVGAARQAVFLAGPRLSDPGKNPALVDAFLRALSWIGDEKRMEEILEKEMQATQSVARLQELAQLAEEKNLPKIAGRIYQKILKEDFNDEKALKRLGYMAFYAGEWENVVGYLGRYLARHDDTYEPFFYLAEVYRSLGMVEKAKPFYLKALAKVEKIQDPPFSVRVAWTRMYQRVGRWPEALKGYEKLMREQPDDSRLKADYVELLLARGMSREAENVLRFAGVR